MNDQHYKVCFTVDQSPEEVFHAINNVSGWWTENISGNSKNLNDEFTVQFGDVHYSKQKLTELTPGKKVVWLVTESRLSFTKDEKEWTGTEIVFDITPAGNKTEVCFSHIGLVPQIECYKDCSNAWGGYISNSLRNLITEGKGNPEKK